jgi:integrase
MAKERSTSAKDGRYEGAAFVPTTAGTFKRVRVYGRTHEDVRRQLTKLLEQADRGIPVAAESWTVAKYLAYWLEHVVRPERKPRTYQGYEGVVRLYLIPELGSKRLAKLTAQDVRVFITRIRAQCLCCKHGVDAARDVPQCCARPGGECCASRVSVRMVQSIHAVLRNALESAVREEVIPRNVAKLVKVTTPKYAVNRGLSVVQARQVLKAANGERLYALYVLALCLGLRRGELLGLRWQDADLETGTLEVIQTLQRVGGALRSYGPRPRTPHAPSRSRRCASTRSVSTGGSSSPSGPTPGRIGKGTGSSSRPGSALLWSPTTSAVAGAASAPKPG